MNFWFFLWTQSRAVLGSSRHLIQPAEQWLRGQKCSLLPSLLATSGQGSLVGGGVKPNRVTAVASKGGVGDGDT